MSENSEVKGIIDLSKKFSGKYFLQLFMKLCVNLDLSVYVMWLAYDESDGEINYK